MSKELYLLRGLPGAGKSTLAGALGAKHLEADMYFSKDGEYNFNATKLKAAHEWCRSECERAMGWDLKIAVSNTFTQEWEMKAYYDLAKQYGYRVFSIIVENRHGGVNTHNVPAETLEKMKKRFDVKLL
jgi:predicted kinase